MEKTISRTALLGYYGRFNFGDDLMVRDFAEYLSSKGRQVKVISGGGYLNEVLKIQNVSIVSRKFASLINTVIWCDEFIMAGGTIFHDSYRKDSSKWYAIHLWIYAILLQFARIMGKRVRMIGVGIGPLNGPISRMATKVALNAAHKVYVRDSASRCEVEKLLSQNHTKIILGPDLTYLSATALRIRAKSHSPDHKIAVSVIDMSQFLDEKIAEEFWKPIMQGISNLMEDDHKLRLSLFSFWTAEDRPNDSLLVSKLICELPESYKDRIKCIDYNGDPDTIIDEMIDCKYVLATRFHAAVVAQALGRPYGVVLYNRKVKDFANDNNVSKKLRIKADSISSPDEIRDTLSHLLSHSPILEESSKLYERARDAVQSALED